MPKNTEPTNPESVLQLPDFLIIPTILFTDPKIKSLDREVYGVIYWYQRLAMKKCVLKNNSFSKLLNCKQQSIANSLSRLCKGNYIKVVMDENNHRAEIIPLIVFTLTPQSNGVTPQSKGGYSIEEGGSVKNEGSALKSDSKKSKPNKNNRIKENNTLSESTELLSDKKAPIKNLPTNGAQEKAVACTEEELYYIADKDNISLYIVKAKHREILDIIERGEWKKKYKTVFGTLRGWLRWDLKKGYIDNMTEQDRLSLPDQHPDEVRKWEAAKRLLKERGDL